MIETTRLLLRDWREDDIPLFAAMNQDPRVMEFFPALLTPEETASRVAWYRAHWQQHSFGLQVVELKKTGEFMGFTGLAIPTFTAHFTPCVEIGWRFATRFWGKGYATEAARAVLDMAFEKHSLTEVVSFASRLNTRSMRVMEKLGMTRNPEDDFNHPALPKEHRLVCHALYRLTIDEWQSLK